MLLSAQRDANKSEPALDVPQEPELTAALLRAARREVRSHAMGSRAFRRQARLAWEALAEVYGGEDVLNERVRALRSSGLTVDAELLDLAERYVSGWRPSEFGGGSGEEGEDGAQIA